MSRRPLRKLFRLTNTTEPQGCIKPWIESARTLKPSFARGTAETDYLRIRRTGRRNTVQVPLDTPTTGLRSLRVLTPGTKILPLPDKALGPLTTTAVWAPTKILSPDILSSGNRMRTTLQIG